MKDEKLFIYHYSVQKKQAEQLCGQIESCGLEVTCINLDVIETDRELVNGLIEKSDDPFPILRIGENKIRAMFQNPSFELVHKLFTSSTSHKYEFPKATIYCTTWCGDCHQLKMWMDSQNIPYDEILIENSEDLKEQIARWSGGRRVIPTVDYESIGRLFNPGIAVFQKMYK